MNLPGWVHFDEFEIAHSCLILCPYLKNDFGCM